jgi:hypothetical protein
MGRRWRVVRKTNTSSGEYGKTGYGLTSHVSGWSTCGKCFHTLYTVLVGIHIPFPYLCLLAHLSESINVHIINHSQTNCMPINVFWILSEPQKYIEFVMSTKRLERQSVWKVLGTWQDILSEVSRDFLQSFQINRGISTLNQVTIASLQMLSTSLFTVIESFDVM